MDLVLTQILNMFIKKLILPLKQIDKKENFRRIIDLKNNSGWIHISQLKKNNSVITIQNKILFKKPSSFAKPIAQIEKGRLLIVKNVRKNGVKLNLVIMRDGLKLMIFGA